MLKALWNSVGDCASSIASLMQDASDYALDNANQAVGNENYSDILRFAAALSLPTLFLLKKSTDSLTLFVWLTTRK
jgi:hypothetical protein